MTRQRLGRLDKLPSVRACVGEAEVKSRCLGTAITLLLLGLASFNARCAEDAPGLRDATVLIIRHAEKPEIGSGLSEDGEQRAKAYVHYFYTFQLDGNPLKLDALFAARDSRNSIRPRLTLEPLSRALGIPLDTTFKSKEPGALARKLESSSRGTNILVCWHHEQIPDLLRALGADPAALLPDGQWPGHVYGWVIALRFDHDGHLIPGACKRLKEHLQPDDSK